ncbi:hypothetical protein NEMAJ01_2351, partial [Nematocida major]
PNNPNNPNTLLLSGQLLSSVRHAPIFKGVRLFLRVFAYGSRVLRVFACGSRETDKKVRLRLTPGRKKAPVSACANRHKKKKRLRGKRACWMHPAEVQHEEVGCVCGGWPRQASAARGSLRAHSWRARAWCARPGGLQSRPSGLEASSRYAAPVAGPRAGRHRGDQRGARAIPLVLRARARRTAQ